MTAMLTEKQVDREVFLVKLEQRIHEASLVFAGFLLALAAYAFLIAYGALPGPSWSAIGHQQQIVQQQDDPAPAPATKTGMHFNPSARLDPTRVHSEPS